jgi:hypothetical protein
MAKDARRDRRGRPPLAAPCGLGRRGCGMADDVAVADWLGSFGEKDGGGRCLLIPALEFALGLGRRGRSESM